MSSLPAAQWISGGIRHPALLVQRLWNSFWKKVLENQVAHGCERVEHLVHQISQCSTGWSPSHNERGEVTEVNMKPVVVVA